ncbi:MAG: ABC transporter ATP-binding protein [Verrucomicrobiales bacterium]|nr:ABC transporter ATP-binding protein [Verrucomicrobiales bacterium]
MPPRGNTILKVSNLKRSYGNFVAVDGLNLQVNEGEIYGFLGVNGAGKTTTIRMLMGIITPEAGTIELMGETTKRTSLKQKQKIGYVSQEQVFYPWMTAQMLGKFVGGLYPDWDKQEFERLLQVLEVPPNRKSSHLSGGMRVKLALALALAPRPSLLILDEPTAGMDPVARREFLDIIEHQAREYGRTTFFSTHLLNEVERAADKVGIIHRGKTRFEGDLTLLQSRVRKIQATEGTVLPAGFEVWQILDPDPITGQREMVVDAPPEMWADSSIAGEKLSLDDIFISCVGVATMRI